MSASNSKEEHLMDMNKKEIWINNTLNSIDSIEQVPVSDNLAFRLGHIYKSSQVVVYRIQPKVRWAIAAALTTLFLINVYTLSKTLKRENSEKAVFANEYFSYMNSI